MSTVRASWPCCCCAAPRKAWPNIAAHAQASDVDVIIDADGEQLMLTVRDNGIGPGIADMAPQRCHGLRELRARATYLGGTMTLAPAPERGSILTVTLPLKQTSGAGD